EKGMQPCSSMTSNFVRSPWCGIRSKNTWFSATDCGPRTTDLFIVTVIGVLLQFQLLHDQFIELGLRVASGHAERILDRLVAGAAVADDADAINTEQRRSALGAVIVAFDEG